MRYLLVMRSRTIIVALLGLLVWGCGDSVNEPPSDEAVAKAKVDLVPVKLQNGIAFSFPKEWKHFDLGNKAVLPDLQAAMAKSVDMSLALRPAIEGGFAKFIAIDPAKFDVITVNIQPNSYPRTMTDAIRAQVADAIVNSGYEAPNVGSAHLGANDCLIVTAKASGQDRKAVLNQYWFMRKDYVVLLSFIGKPDREKVLRPTLKAIAESMVIPF